LSAWTNNGQNIFLEISFFARFISQDSKKVRQFYFDYGEHWKGYFVRMSYGKIKEITADFQELDFYQEREMINKRLTKELSQIFLE